MKIPRDCDGVALSRALRVFGDIIARQTGSHMTLTTQNHGEHHVTIPAHRPIKVGTLQGILKSVARHHGIAIDDLLRELGL